MSAKGCINLGVPVAQGTLGSAWSSPSKKAWLGRKHAAGWTRAGVVSGLLGCFSGGASSSLSLRALAYRCRKGRGHVEQKEHA